MKLPLTIPALLALAASGAGAQSPDPTFREVVDTPGLPRVLLIGDSISMGYTEDVRNLLRGKANVHRIPENGGPTSHGVERIAGWLGDGKWDVIHFNFGLHDLKIMEGARRQVPLPQYVTNLKTIVERLAQTKAALVWATTTPVPSGNLNPPRETTDVPKYNAAAKEVMDAHGIATNDLYMLVLPRLSELQLPENVHFSEQGSSVLAAQVAESIRRAMTR